MARRQRAKKPAVQSLQTIDEVDAKVAEIGQLQRELQVVEAKMNKSIEAVKAEYGPHADAIRQKINDDLLEIEAFASVHRDELTDGGKTKTVFLRSGRLAWRLTPPAVSIRDVAEAITQLKELGLETFLRVKTEIDRQAMRANPAAVEAVDGVTITQREEFVVTPDESQAEVIKKGKVV